MKIGITGGTGLIGSGLSEHAILAGHHVVIYSRTLGIRSNDAQIVYRYWDPVTGEMDPTDDLDVIINLAGASLASSLWTPKRKGVIRSSRMYAGRTIVDTLSRSRTLPKVFFQASAIGGYGISQVSEFTESAPLGDGFLSSVCKDWEASTEKVDSMGIRRIVGRIGLVLHPTAGFLPKLKLPTQWMVGGRLGTGRQWYSWIHRDDLTRAIFHVIESSQFTGAVNLTAPSPERMDDFGRMLAKVLHKPYWFPVPAFALRLVLGGMSTLVLEGQNVIPGRLLESEFKFQYDQLEAALRDLYD